jgi:ketosteroid isomerase-like protein
MRMCVVRRLSAAALTVALTVGLPALGRAQDPAKTAIDAANKKFVAAFTKQDASAVAATYSPDGNAFPPNSPIVKGRAAIQKMWQDVINSGITSIALATTEVESGGTIAYEAGTYELKTKDGKVADRGKYCVVWKKLNGQWMLHRDIWSTDMPAAK